jgi:hypothetical protein
LLDRAISGRLAVKEANARLKAIKAFCEQADDSQKVFTDKAKKVSNN